MVWAASTCKGNVVDRDVRGFVGGTVFTSEEHLERQRVSTDRGSLTKGRDQQNLLSFLAQRHLSKYSLDHRASTKVGDSSRNKRRI